MWGTSKTSSEVWAMAACLGRAMWLTPSGGISSRSSAGLNDPFVLAFLSEGLARVDAVRSSGTRVHGHRVDARRCRKRIRSPGGGAHSRRVRVCWECGLAGRNPGEILGSGGIGLEQSGSPATQRTAALVL